MGCKMKDLRGNQSFQLMFGSVTPDPQIRVRKDFFDSLRLIAGAGQARIFQGKRSLATAEAPLKKCRKYRPGSPFSADLDCKRCAYYVFGKLNGRKIRQSLETTDRQEAAQKLLQMEAEAKAPVKYTVSEAVNRFTTELEGSGYAPKSVQRYKYRLKRLINFLSSRGVAQLRSVTIDDLSAWKATWNQQTDLGKRKEQERLQ